MPIAEIQSHWIADLLQGHGALPPEREMYNEIARYRAVTTKRYGRSTRPAIQVDFLAYLREIAREREMGARHGRASHAIAADPPAPRILQPAGSPFQA